MPRRPLDQISANIPGGEEFTPFTRSKILTLREEGGEIRDVSDCFNISENTAKKTVKAAPYCAEGKSIPRTKRP